METLKQLFGCCIPGRRDQRSGSQGQDESTPLLNDGRSRAAGAAAGTGASPHASQEGIADDSSPTGSPPSEPEAPAYTPRDLAVITGWAREQFLRVNDPRALEGKRRSIIESVDSAEGKEIEQVRRRDDEEVSHNLNRLTC